MKNVKRLLISILVIVIVFWLLRLFESHVALIKKVDQQRTRIEELENRVRVEQFKQELQPIKEIVVEKETVRVIQDRQQELSVPSTNLIPIAVVGALHVVKQTIGGGSKWYFLRELSLE